MVPPQSPFGNSTEGSNYASSAVEIRQRRQACGKLPIAGQDLGWRFFHTFARPQTSGEIRQVSYPFQEDCKTEEDDSSIFEFSAVCFFPANVSFITQ